MLWLCSLISYSPQALSQPATTMLRVANQMCSITQPACAVVEGCEVLAQRQCNACHTGARHATHQTARSPALKKGGRFKGAVLPKANCLQQIQLTPAAIEMCSRLDRKAWSPDSSPERLQRPRDSTSAHLAADMGRVPARCLGRLLEAPLPRIGDVYQALGAPESVHDVIDAAHALLNRSAGKRHCRDCASGLQHHAQLERG